MRRATRRFGAGALALAFLVGTAGRPARADITFYDLLKSMDYIQTGPSAPVAPVEYDGNAGIASAVGDFTNASITSSSPISPYGMTSYPGGATWYIGLTTKAQLDADIPNAAEPQPKRTPARTSNAPRFAVVDTISSAVHPAIELS